MKRVYRAPDIMLAGYVQVVLERHGIDCLVRNAFLLGAVGELPPAEALPEVWVLDDGDHARATALVAELLEASAGTDWRCSLCAEHNEGQFGVCWSCGERAPPA